MGETSEALVNRLYTAFNQRDEAAIAELCSPRMEFFAVTAEEDYLDDVAQVWEELLIAASRIERREDRLLVVGRVYVRNRELGIRDMPVAWIWWMEDGLFVRGEVFADPEQAVAHFVQAPA